MRRDEASCRQSVGKHFGVVVTRLTAPTRAPTEALLLPAAIPTV
jgi:hypothetical protein